MKKLTYFAFAHMDGKALWCEFPDLPGCFSDGKNLEELMQRASYAMEGWTSSVIDDGGKLPKPTGAEELEAKTRECEEPVIFIFPVTCYVNDNVPARINITSTASKIAEITAFAKRTRRTRSELMVNATLEYIKANA